MSFNFEKALIAVLKQQNGEEPVVYDPDKSKLIDYRRRDQFRFYKKSKARRKIHISSFRSENKRFCNKAMSVELSEVNNFVEPIFKKTSI